MKSFLTSVFSFSLKVLLIWAVITNSAALMGVSAAAYWIVILLGVVMCPVVLCVSCGTPTEKGVEFINGITKTKNIVYRIWGWISFALIIALFAYDGWIFTAVSYAVVGLLCRLCISIAREKLKDNE